MRDSVKSLGATTEIANLEERALWFTVYGKTYSTKCISCACLVACELILNTRL